MLIRALFDYYDILESEGKVEKEEYSRVNIHYLVALTSEGDIADIIDCRKEETLPAGKSKIKAESFQLPKRTEKTSIEANIIEHRPLYIFGLDYDKNDQMFTSRIPGVSDAKAVKPIRSHEAFVTETLTFLDGLDSPIVNAYREFVKNWNPEQQSRNPHLLAISKSYAVSGYAFCLSGNPGILLHEDAAVRQKWEAYYAERQTSVANTVTARCSMTGEHAPIARTHSKISGLFGGLSMGNSLVCFNNDAEWSYGVEQSYNSNISENAMRRYVAALNYLIQDRSHHTTIDDMTVIYWAMSETRTYTDWFNYLLTDDLPSGLNVSQMDDILKSAFSNIKEGKSGIDSLTLPDDLDPSVEFVIAGLKPNSSRIAVKFVHRQQYGHILRNIIQHQLDMKPFEKARSIALWQIRKELLSPKSSNDAVDPSLSAKLMQSIISGTPYPSSLLTQMVKRVKTDQDQEGNPNIKINPVRIGVIKACINRQSRFMGQKEEITMSLDVKNTNPAYLCGRLFAVLEATQQSASSSKLNRTIKDAYFSSAASTPAIIFPKLLKLAQYHLGKSAHSEDLNRSITIIINMLGNEFPANLSLTEQGKFIIGYYQQNNVLNHYSEHKED